MNIDLKAIVMTVENYFFYAVVCLMPIFAAISVFNRLRFKNVKLAIQHGALGGYPLLPTIYAIVQLGCIVIACSINDDESVAKFSFYLIASLFWFLGSAAAEQRLITDVGIVLSINTHKHALMRWVEVSDYYAKQKKNYIEYHFFRNAPKGTRPAISSKHHAKRSLIVIRVQNRQKSDFESLLKEHLEHRFEVDPVKIFRGEFKP